MTSADDDSADVATTADDGSRDSLDVDTTVESVPEVVEADVETTTGGSSSGSTASPTSVVMASKTPSIISVALET